jgi:hypothetical protein
MPPDAHYIPTMLTLLLLTVAAAESGGRVEYIGGTVSSVEERTSGRLMVTDPANLSFVARKTKVTVAYRGVNLLEYGQKADRRYVAAVLISPMFLLSKKRDHFVTVGYSDESGRQQALVFRIEKNDVRKVLASLEARTGLKVQYQDNEARKAAWGSR